MDKSVEELDNEGRDCDTLDIPKPSHSWLEAADIRPTLDDECQTGDYNINFAFYLVIVTMIKRFTEAFYWANFVTPQSLA